jgi:hypothetical protein
MEVAIQQTNNSQGPIESPDSNGQPKIEPVFLAFKNYGVAA